MVRIRVPVEMLKDASLKLNRMETAIAQNNTTLTKAWNGLWLEARSRQTVEARVNEARSMAGRLSNQSQNMGNYLKLVGVRFVEADRKCSDGALKGASSTMHAAGKGVLHPGVIAERAKYEQLNDEYKKQNIYEDKNPELVSTSQLSWFGGILNSYSNTHLPYSGVPGAAVNLADNVYYESDLYTTLGDLTVDVSKIAAGVAITGAAVAVLPALPAIAVVGAGIVVGAGVSIAVSYGSNISIGDKTVDRWLKDGTAYNIKTLTNNPSLMLAGPVAPAVTSFNYFSKETVGIDIISGIGNMAGGLRNKIFNR